MAVLGAVSVNVKLLDPPVDGLSAGGSPVPPTLLTVKSLASAVVLVDGPELTPIVHDITSFTRVGLDALVHDSDDAVVGLPITMNVSAPPANAPPPDSDALI